jgi:hypothetical protein
VPESSKGFIGTKTIESPAVVGGGDVDEEVYTPTKFRNSLPVMIIESSPF